MNFKGAFNHLKNDKVMLFLISKFKNDITLNDRYESDYSKAISMLIIEQQVSFKAAITIKKRFLTLIKNKSKVIFWTKTKINKSNLKLINHINLNIGLIKETDIKKQKEILLKKEFMIGDTDSFITI